MQVRKMMMFPFLKHDERDPIFFVEKKQHHMPFTKTWGEAKHDPMSVETWWFPQGGFCGGYDPGDSLVCDCGLETLRKPWRCGLLACGFPKTCG